MFDAQQSETIDQIATALASAQAELRNPPKTKEANVRSDKGNFKYRYVDFADGLDIVRPILGKHGICFVQTTPVDGDQMWLVTKLVHSSGQWISSPYPVGRIGAHQALGAALSYARRYSLFAMVGIVGEDDDDGEADARRVAGETREQAELRLAKEARAYHDHALEQMGEIESLDRFNAWWESERKNRQLHFQTNDDPLFVSLKQAAGERKAFLAAQEKSDASA